MSKKRPRRRAGKVLLAIVLVLAAGTGGYTLYQRQNQQEETLSVQNYKEETVRRGSVSSEIQEGGTIEYGTTEQTFTVAEVTTVSASSDTDSSASQDGGSGTAVSSGQSSAQQGGGESQGAAAVENTVSMTGASGMASGSDSSSGNSETGESTSLVVEEVYIAPGQTVEEGDQLLKITDASIQEYREQLEAAVASAELLVSKEEINVETKQAEADYTYQMYLAEGETAEETYQATITSLEEAVTELEEEIADTDDEDELEALEAELKIAQNNLTTGTIEAEQVYENAMTNYKYADQLYQIDTDGLEDDLNEAKDTLTECEENLAEFEEQIGDGIIYAEYSGTVMDVAYSAGDTLVSDAAVVTFLDSEDVSMTVSVSQDDISNVAVGDVVTVYLTAYDGEPFEAEVTDISTTASTGSSTVSYEVTAGLTGDTSKVYTGMTGEVSIAGRTEEDTLYISNQAVHLDGTRSWVKVLNEDGTIVETDIETGFSNGKAVAVESGLEEGQIVLIESQVTQ